MEQNEANYESIDKYLPRNIESTRKARIEAERRLLANDALVRHVNIYYACLTMTLTLLSVFNNASYLPFLSIASSVILTTTIIYASSQNYISRAGQMRLCYTSLQELSFKADTLATKPEFVELGKEYTEILRCTENHLPKDYQKILDQATDGLKNRRAAADALIRVVAYIGPLILFFLLVKIFQAA